MSHQCNCTECNNPIKEQEQFCSACKAAIPYNLINRELVDFMTEETKPNMAPRADHG